MKTCQWILSHSFDIDAAHALKQLPIGHSCNRIHGHTWRFTIQIAATQLDAYNFVCDFAEVKHICREYIISRLDHRYINDVLPYDPTCEVLAQWTFLTLVPLIKQISKNVHLWKVTVTENIKDGNSVTYWEADHESSAISNC